MKQVNMFAAMLFLLVMTNLRQSISQDINTSAAHAMQTHYITSAYNGKTYQLNVSLPVNYSMKDSARYPVLYVLDGKFSFKSMCSIREMFDLGKEIRDIIIVCIDDSCNSGAEWLASRYNDFTPSSMLQSDTLWSKIMNVAEGRLRSGGAADFLNTLEKQLIPFIDDHYKTSSDRGLSGHSLGGLFAGYCLLKKPELFNRYGINSPSFWWNNGEMLRNEEDYASRHTGLPARVFFSIGGAEDYMMLSSFNKFTNAVRDHHYQGLAMTVKTFDEETHLSVVPACSSRTLKVLYGVIVQ